MCHYELFSVLYGLQLRFNRVEFCCSYSETSLSEDLISHYFYFLIIHFLVVQATFARKGFHM